MNPLFSNVTMLAMFVLRLTSNRHQLLNSRKRHIFSCVFCCPQRRRHRPATTDEGQHLPENETILSQRRGRPCVRKSEVQLSKLLCQEHFAEPKFRVKVCEMVLNAISNFFLTNDIVSKIFSPYLRMCICFYFQALTLAFF